MQVALPERATDVRKVRKVFPTASMNMMSTSWKDKSALQLEKIRFKKLKDIEDGKKNMLIRIVTM